MPTTSGDEGATTAAVLLHSLARGFVTLWLVLSVCTLAPLVAGSSSFVITSGSMSPTIRPGDVLVARPVPADALRVGQVVVADEGIRRVAHRIVALRPDGTIVLQGDANRQADSTPVPLSRIVGVGHLLVPMVGSVPLWASTGQWLQVLAALAVGGIAVAAGWRHGRRTRQ